MPFSRLLLALATTIVPLAAQEPAEPWRTTKTALYLAFTHARQHVESARAGIELAHQASLSSLEGRPGEAEALAERSFALLKDVAPPSPLWLDPLQTLAAAQLDQQKIGKARETVRRMRELPTSRPEDRARVEGTAGALEQITGSPDRAETHFRNAWAAWQQAGKADSAEASTVLIASARSTPTRAATPRPNNVDRALAALNASRNGTRLDRIKLWNNRAVLYGRQSKWRAAESEMRAAVVAAGSDPPLDPLYLATLLSNFAQILRGNHHGAEARANDDHGDGNRRLAEPAESEHVRTV